MKNNTHKPNYRPKKTSGRQQSEQRRRPKRTVEQPEVETEAVGSEDFAHGRHAVLEALKAERVNKLFIQEELSGAKIEELKSLAQEKAVPVQWVPKSKLEKLIDSEHHQGVVAGLSPYRYLTLEELLAQTAAKEDPFYLLLDGLEDPHNFGSILRTADATGVDGIIIPKHRAVGVTSIVAKTSTGAVEHLPIARVTNLKQAAELLKEKGFWLFGTDMEGTDYRSWQTKGPLGLIIGNEGKGMSTLMKKEVDEMLTIPMVGHVQSLNASVATGVLLYEVYRQRFPQ